MPRKVIIDSDPGIDDAMAICLGLFHPDLEVVAVTATAGNVDAAQASRNVQSIVEQLDPPRLPRIGIAHRGDGPLHADGRLLHGDDGLGNVGLPISELHHQHAAEKLIGDIIRAVREDVTVIALGPLSNLARVVLREPEMAAMVGRVVMTGGSVQAGGNITPAAEFNMFCDPDAARAVFRSPMTKTLVPLDVTNRVIMGMDLMDALPGDETRAGRLLRRIVPYFFRSVRQHLGIEGIYVHGVVSLLTTVYPELFQTRDMAGDVETNGMLTMGATIFDQRSHREWRNNMEVVVDLDVAAIRERIVEGLSRAGDRSGKDV